MKVPIFGQKKFVREDGFLTSETQTGLDVLTQQLQANFSDDGLVVPPATTDDINNAANPANDNAKPDGTMWYDTDTKQFKGKVDGVVKVFTVT